MQQGDMNGIPVTGTVKFHPSGGFTGEVNVDLQHLPTLHHALVCRYVGECLDDSGEIQQVTGEVSLMPYRSIHGNLVFQGLRPAVRSTPKPIRHAEHSEV